MTDGSMSSILSRLRRLGPDWHKKLADEMTGEERNRLAEALDETAQSGKPFTLIVVDEDHKTFSVEGLMNDDRPWKNAIAKAQGQGRNVRCHSPGGVARIDILAAERLYAETHHGYNLMPAGSIVRPDQT